MSLDTSTLSARLRARAVDLDRHQLLVTNFHNTGQEPDLAEPANCQGFGRIRHFRRQTTPGWPANPLPLDPACAALGLPTTDLLRAQVFQNAACNWRCWYCFVPFSLLSANPAHSAWLDAETLVELYLDQPDPPAVIDLTGGQPDLVPEWVPWMMRALTARDLASRVYLWSDDNLSNDYFWRYLSDDDISLVADYPNYGKVACFKGFDPTSFAFNTKAAPELFDQQFDLFTRHADLGLDCYAYATFTTPIATAVNDAMARFVDRIQAIAEYLPLRTVPLEIAVYSPMHARLGPTHHLALEHQWRAIEAWHTELDRRFTASQRATPITKIPLRKGPHHA
jgi:uncharacterized Fe-S cluster-containing radical SAM superfamily protein